MPMKGFQTEKFLNTTRGKAIVGAATPTEILKVFGHLDALEELLDTEIDPNDGLGTEGWRHFVGLD